jgi:hypothetical protein
MSSAKSQQELAKDREDLAKALDRLVNRDAIPHEAKQSSKDAGNPLALVWQRLRAATGKP